MSKKVSKYISFFDYFDKSFIVLSVASGGGSGGGGGGGGGVCVCVYTLPPWRLLPSARCLIHA